MRSALAGAGVAVSLGLITGMVVWKLASLRHWVFLKPTTDHIQGNSSDYILAPSVDQAHVNDSGKTESFNFTRPFSDSSIGNVSRAVVSPYSLCSDSTSRPTAVSNTFSASPEGFTENFNNETIALNSSLILESNATEVSFDSDDTRKNSSIPTNSTEDDIDYVKMGQVLLTEATMILDTGIWDFERRTEDGDAIFSRQLDSGNMVYRLCGIVDMPPQDLLVIIWDGLADYPKWNPTLLDCRVLEKINDQTDISYTVSAPGARGYIASRDFVSLRHWELRHNSYIAASKSIDFPSAPHNSDYIRGKNGPGCMELRPLSSDPSKTEFRWLLNTKLNGWIPSYIADKGYKKFMTKYMIFLREYCKKIKKRVTDSTTAKNVTE